MLEKPVQYANCDAMVGLAEAAEILMANIEDTETMDTRLISVLQAAEHYETAHYGAVVA